MSSGMWLVFGNVAAKFLSDGWNDPACCLSCFGLTPSPRLSTRCLSIALPVGSRCLTPMQETSSSCRRSLAPVVDPK